jgi:ABC-type transporter Mla subunit MlaD
MARSLGWRNLVGGITALVALVALSVIILVFGNVNSLHGKTVRVYAAVGAARGVLRGTEVWLYGRRVGIVDEVAFAPTSSDSLQRLVIAMDVLDEFREQIRHDSHAQIRSGGTLIGSPVVYVSAGSPRGRPITNGDTIRSLPQADFETVGSQFAVASREFPAIISNLKLMNLQLHSASGTLGAFGIDNGAAELDATRARLSRLSTRVDSSAGTIGLALNSRPTLIARAKRVMARADSLKQVALSEQSVVGPFRRDSTLTREIEAVMLELATVRALMNSPNGTAGRIRADSAVARAVAQTQAEMSTLFRDAKRQPIRYIHF